MNPQGAVRAIADKLSTSLGKDAREWHKGHGLGLMSLGAVREDELFTELPKSRVLARLSHPR